MKLLYLADPHGKGKNPCNRLDNYYQSWLEKIKEVIEIANVNSCDKIICGGDLFDSPNVSNTIIDDFVDLVEESGINWQVVPGNHDMSAHNWELSKSSALAHMFRRSKIISQLTELSCGGVNIEKCIIKGYKYYHTIEEDMIENGLMCDSDAEFKIAVPHAFISIKPFFKDVSHICAKDLKTNYDLILCSHFHMTFDETINGTRFINPNSLGRTSIREQHMPEVLIVDTETREIEKINLQSAKQIGEIFDLEKYEELKGKKKDIKEFLDSLKDVDFQSMDLGQQIVKMGKNNNIDDSVVNHLLEIMEKTNE